MRTLIRNTLMALLMVAGLVVIVAPSAMALDCGTDKKPGADYNKPACKVKEGVGATGANDPSNNTCGPNRNQECTLGERIKQVINILLFLIGTISVIMIIIGGIRYVLSNGDQSQITAAKNTIMYAVIGLVVALLAYAIVNFVVTQFT